MIRHLFNRAREVIKTGGVKAYVLHLKRCLYLKPLLDESWFMLNYFLHPSHKVVVKVQGSKMRLNLADKGINRDLFLSRCREPECTRLYREELAEGMKVADIGANIGYYVLMETRVVGSSGKIYAVEPSPDNFRQLRANVELNRPATPIEFHNLAIANKKAKMRFQLSGTSNNHRLAPLDGTEDVGTVDNIEVDTISLDELLGDNEVDYIRMDPEGGEWFIFQGMSNILRRPGPLKMFLELHPKLIKEFGGDIEQLLKLLADCGFRLKYLVVWEPDSHYLIPYIKGRCPVEKTIKYDRPLKELLEDEDARRELICESGHRFMAGYKVFLEKSC
ncbi:MAG: FkbM family methyltransferase [Victivallaceae bacterium]|nr:FkbM family methyltransferase [Victivallaceae bacterium]